MLRKTPNPRVTVLLANYITGGSSDLIWERVKQIISNNCLCNLCVAVASLCTVS